MEIQMQKAANGVLIPSDEQAQEGLRKLKLGQDVRVKVTRQRNYEFLKKWFALANLAFDYWEPPEIESKYQNVKPEKNFDRFRKDLTILAGYFDATYRINGDVRIEAKSISFGSMSEDEFEKLYSATIDAVIKHVCSQYDDDMLRGVVDQTLAFA